MELIVLVVTLIYFGNGIILIYKEPTNRMTLGVSVYYEVHEAMISYVLGRHTVHAHF